MRPVSYSLAWPAHSCCTPFSECSSFFPPRPIVHIQISPAALQGYVRFEPVSQKASYLVIRIRPASTGVAQYRDQHLGRECSLDLCAGDDIDPIHRLRDMAQDSGWLKAKVLAQMPVANSEIAIDLDLLPVHNAIGDLWSKQRLGNFDLYRCRALVEGEAFVVGKLHPHEIDRHREALVAGLHNSHQADVEVFENVAEAGMDAGLVTERTHRSVHSREPQIGRDANEIGRAHV